MEIGSFIELDLFKTGEYHNFDEIVRLNSGRSAIYHSVLCYGCNEIYIPYYICPSVPEFLRKRSVDIVFYNINSDLIPIIDKNESNSCFLLVNYFGIFSQEELEYVGSKYDNVIIDNSQSFFSTPIMKPNFINIYSPRKFFGVPDGGYVIGNQVPDFSGYSYENDISSDTSLFLLKRIEMGSSESYTDRMSNEKRIDDSDVLFMSLLTRRLLESINYKAAKKKRAANFRYAEKIFSGLNNFDLSGVAEKDVLPMVYPLVIHDESILEGLKERNIYTGRWWSHVLRIKEANETEKLLSKFMLPIPIDHRYGESEIDFIYKTLDDLLKS